MKIKSYIMNLGYLIIKKDNNNLNYFILYYIYILINQISVDYFGNIE
jgi:hypothetical protein